LPISSGSKNKPKNEAPEADGKREVRQKKELSGRINDLISLLGESLLAPQDRLCVIKLFT
jgi:hypothetical protein